MGAESAVVRGVGGGSVFSCPCVSEWEVWPKAMFGSCRDCGDEGGRDLLCYSEIALDRQPRVRLCCAGGHCWALSAKA